MPADSIPETATPQILVNTATEPMAAGPFKARWSSLAAYTKPTTTSTSGPAATTLGTPQASVRKKI